MADLIRHADVEALRDKAREAQRAVSREWLGRGGGTYASTQHLRDRRDRLENEWEELLKAWHTQEESWQAPPAEARWYGEVIITVDGETTDVSGYSGAEFEPDPSGLVADGVKIIESTVKPTRGNKALEPPESDD